MSQSALFKVHIVHVGNFEFIARTGFCPADFLEDRGIVEIDTGNGKIGFRLLRLFLNAQNPAVGNLGAAEALRIRNFLEKDVGSSSLLFESFC